MDRIFASGASGSAPAVPASPSSGYPTAGNPGTGTPATKPGPYWYHMIVEKMMSIISAAGIAPSQGNLTQLLMALRSAGVFQTLAQFDNSTKVATTAFVAQNGVRFSDFGSVPGGNFTFALTDLPKIIAVLANGQTVTLPPVTNAHLGYSFRLFVYPGTSYSITVQSNVGAQISTPTLLLSSITVSACGYVDFVWEGASTNHWEASGVGLLAYTPDFAATLSSTGQQRLPGGFVLKWGAYNLGPLAASASSSGAVLFPAAFPASCFAAALITADKLILTGTNGFSASQISGNFLNNFTTPQNMAGTYFAIGK